MEEKIIIFAYFAAIICAAVLVVVALSVCRNKDNYAPVTKIPRKIHMTVPEFPLSALIQANVDKLSQRNPGWEIVMYTNEKQIEYLKQNYSEYMPHFNSINPALGAARADLFRYLLLYREGGVYLDCKSMIHWPLDDVIGSEHEFLINTNGAWMCDRFPYGEINQWIIITKPRSPFLEQVVAVVTDNIERYNKKIHYAAEKDYELVSHSPNLLQRRIFMTTGPIMYSDTILSLLDQHQHTFTSIGFASRINPELQQEDGAVTKSIYGKRRKHYLDLPENTLVVV